MIALWFGALLSAGAWFISSSADDVRGAGAPAGAFALQEDSKDAALVIPLFPGNGTVQVSGVNNAAGLAIMEVSDLP